MAGALARRRAELFFRIRELFHAHREDIATLLTAEHGKVLSDALGEVARGIEVIEFCCGIPTLLKGGYSEQASTGVDVYSMRQPLGVVAGITPFNFPAMVPMWMWAPALACGNTFVLKPSEKDPSASLLIAELLAEAGVPDGVFNVVQGDKVAVDAILEHPEISAVSFVGSTPIARYVYETATANGKRCQALGGAKNHMIVLPDADIDMAADAAVSAGYGSAGERCMAVSMVVAVGGVADELVRRSRRASRSEGRRPARSPAPRWARSSRGSTATRSPPTSSARRARARPSLSTGARAACRRRLLPRALADRQRQAGDGQLPDEIFGPVLGVTRVDTYDEAIRLVNENPYGNGTAIFTRDGGVARQFEFDVQAGMVGINVPIPVPVAYYSFGGWKARSSATGTSTGPRGSTSTRARRSSPRAGRTRRSRRSISASPRLDKTAPLIRPALTAAVAAVVLCSPASACPRRGRRSRSSGTRGRSRPITVQRRRSATASSAFAGSASSYGNGQTVADRLLCTELRCAPGATTPSRSRTSGAARCPRRS